MSDKPIIFSAPMVNALLAGRKCQTRRVLGPGTTLINGRGWNAWGRGQPWDYANAWVDPGPSPAGNPGPYLKVPIAEAAGDEWGGTVHRFYPIWQRGDRLWVKEAWAASRSLDRLSPTAMAEACLDAGYEKPWAPILYLSDGQWVNFEAGGEGGRRRASIHMPRWASRLTLTVTDVRVQRVQAISEEDAISEGVYRSAPTEEDEDWNRGWCEENGYPYEPLTDVWLAPGTRQGWGSTKEERDRPQWGPTAAFAYRCIWDHLHGPGAWDANPWVAALTFTVHHRNIDL